jgi:hypothetical protein
MIISLRLQSLIYYVTIQNNKEIYLLSFSILYFGIFVEEFGTESALFHKSFQFLNFHVEKRE